MRVGLIHLEGPHRGRTDTPSGPQIRLGTDPRCDVWVEGDPGIEKVHATLSVEGEEVYLRALAPLRLNRRAIHEVILRDGDLLELGEQTKIRFRRNPGWPGGRRRALRLRPILPALLLPLLLGATYFLAREQAAGDHARREAGSRRAALEAQKRAYDGRIESLRSEMQSLVEKTALRSEERVGQVRGEVERAVAGVEEEMVSRVQGAIERSLETNPDLIAARDTARRLEEGAAAAERILARSSGSVCLIQGAYGFAREEGKRLRFLREAEENAAPDEETGQVPLSLEGTGPVFQVEYTGTGFLVDASGLVITNRHIAEPWWKSDSAEPILRDGYKPQFLYLRAFFPGQAASTSIDRKHSLVSEEADIAVLKLASASGLPAPLTLAPPDTLVVGRRVLLLGFPSGINALLARSDEGLSDRVLEQGQYDASEVLDLLAGKNLIRPIPTHGYIGDILADKVIYDAPTAVGGSGGPVLDMEGRVVAINYGILMAFRAANFGVPISFAHKLLERARAR